MSRGDCNADIVKYLVVQPSQGSTITGSTGDFIVGSNLYVCSGTTFTDIIDPCTTGVTINSNFTVFPQRTLPTSDGTKDLGSPIRRFRNINTISGTSTVWTSTDRVITPNLDLGLDSQSNSRIITADNSVIQDDILNGGSY
jgi:hypothetical protein